MTACVFGWTLLVIRSTSLWLSGCDEGAYVLVDFSGDRSPTCYVHSPSP